MWSDCRPTGSTWFTSKVENIIFPDCDGTVAAGDHAFLELSLAAATANGNAVVATDDNKGTDSPTGCGANSRHYVTWSVSAAKTSPPAASTGASGGGGRALGGPTLPTGLRGRGRQRAFRSKVSRRAIAKPWRERQPPGPIDQQT